MQKTNTSEIRHNNVRLREIPGFADYWGGSDGAIYSTKKSNTPYCLKAVINARNSYRQVGLYRDGDYEWRTFRGVRRYVRKVNKRSVHQLVAACWLAPKPSPAHEIDHRDEDRGNNQPSNLRWCTKLENARYYRTAHPDFQRGETDPNAKLTADEVRTIRACRGIVTQRELARRFGLSQTHVWKIQTRQAWTHLP